MNCGNCKHWNLAGSLGQMGHGQCNARPEPLRAAITTTEQNVCRLGKFAKAKPEDIRRRELMGGPVL